MTFFHRALWEKSSPSTSAAAMCASSAASAYTWWRGWVRRASSSTAAASSATTAAPRFDCPPMLLMSRTVSAAFWWPHSSPTVILFTRRCTLEMPRWMTLNWCGLMKWSNFSGLCCPRNHLQDSPTAWEFNILLSCCFFLACKSDLFRHSLTLCYIILISEQSAVTMPQFSSLGGACCALGQAEDCSWRQSSSFS